jgi:hypothetical protein
MMDHVELVFSQPLEMANVLVANGVTLAESRSLELARANLSNVMGQFAAYGLLQFYFFQHHR